MSLPEFIRRDKGDKIMKTTKSMILVAAIFLVPSAQACEERVLGESLDSGLGALASNYTAQEFRPVLGESLDSGLGELGPKYTAQEFVPVRVVGESLDSGLGELTREDLLKFLPAGSSLRKTAQR
jgi:hypothetical protein